MHILVILDAMDDAYWLDVLSEEKRAPNPRDLFAAAYGYVILYFDNSNVHSKILAPFW